MSSKTDISDPDFQTGNAKFTFPNGDTYDGEYCAHRSGVVWREGIGTYQTHDGQIYTGEWRDDKLVEELPIQVVYPTGHQYHGCIVKNKYEGPGMYIFDHKMTVLCEFSNNKPVGDISLIDIKGRTWLGIAAQDDVLLYPEHIYFNNIPENSGKGWQRFLHKAKSRLSENSDMPKNFHMGSVTKSRNKSFTHSASHSKQSKTVLSTEHSKSLILSLPSKSLLQSQKGSQRKSKLSVAQSKAPSKIDMLEKERLAKEELKIFGKTKKTASDLQFENSDWYKNYVDFKAVFEDIKNKISQDGRGSLSEDEKRWFDGYKKFKERYCKIMKNRRDKSKDLTQEEMFELLEDFKNKCPPVMVVYPTGDCGSVCDCEVVNN